MIYLKNILLTIFSVMVAINVCQANLTISFAEPLNGASFNVGDDIEVTVDANDNSLVANIKLYINNQFIRKESHAPYEWSVGNQNDPLLQNMSAGSYVIKAIAKKVGGGTVEETINITVSNNLSISFAEPLNGANFDVGDDIEVTVNTNNNSLVKNIRLFLNNQLVRQENGAPYEWSVGNQNDPLIQNMAAGNYILKAIARKKAGGTVEKSINITVGNPNLSPNISVKNRRVLPDTDQGFPYDDRVIFHKVRNRNDGSVFKMSNYGKIEIANTGNGTLNVSSVQTGSADFQIITGGGAFSLTSGATREVLVKFNRNSGDTGVFETDFTVNSNDPDSPVEKITLAGVYKLGGGSLNEVGAKELVELLGFSTKLTEDGGLFKSNYPTPEEVANGVHGDIVVSKFWEQADPSQPVVSVLLGTFKGPGGNSMNLKNENGQLLDGFKLSYSTSWVQTIFPNTINSSIDAPMSARSGDLSEPFYIQLAGPTTLGSQGTQGNGDPKTLPVRVYKVINVDGTVRPNEYIAFQDYIPGGGCVQDGGLCDFNDNSFYIKNIKPIEEDRVSERSVSYALALSAEFGPKTQVQWVFRQEADKIVKQFTVLHGTTEEVQLQEVGTVVANDDLGVGIYEFLHHDAQEGKNYYQIKVEYEDGSISYPMQGDISFETKPVQLNIAPNPASDILKMDVSKYMEQSIDYTISNLSGEVVKHGSFDSTHSKTVQINLSLFQNGFYIIRIKSENHRAVAAKFMVAKDY